MIALKEKIIEAIKQCYDPEIPVDVYELGLIYDIKIDEKTNNVFIDMTLTSPACPVAGTLPLSVQDKVKEVEEVRDAFVNLVWEPAWNKERMSEEARFALDMF